LIDSHGVDFGKLGAQLARHDAEVFSGLQEMLRLPEPPTGDDLGRRADLALADKVRETRFVGV